MPQRPPKAGHLTTAEAAALLQVSPATLKRWAQSGLIPSERTEGGHRRFRLDDVRALAEPADGAADPARRGADLVAGARDVPTLLSWLLQARRELGSWWSVAAPLREVVAELHRRRSAGAMGAVELEVAIDRLRDAAVRLAEASPAPPGAPRLLVCAVPGDPMLVAPAMIALAAPEAGWCASWGGHPSPADLAEALARQPVEAVVVCGSAAAGPDALRRHAAGLAALPAAAAAPIALAGTGDWPAVRPPLFRAGGVEELHAWLEDRRRVRRVAAAAADGRPGPAEPGQAPHAPEAPLPPAPTGAPRWTPALAIGHPVVDGQHQSLFLQVGAFLATLERGGAGADHADLLAFIADYARLHFRYEERLMRATGFPGLERHREEHERLTAQLGELAARLGPAPARGALLALAAFLERWLLEHVGGSDQRIGEHLRALPAAAVAPPAPAPGYRAGASKPSRFTSGFTEGSRPRKST